MHLGVTGGFGVQLPELLQFLHGQVVARQMQQGVMQHRAVAVTDDKTVTVWPGRVGRVMTIVPVRVTLRPQGHGNFGHAHGHAGVPRLGLLDRVHGQGANGVGQKRGRRDTGRDGGVGHNHSPCKTRHFIGTGS